MGLSFSTTYEQLVKLIEDNDIEGLKKILNSLTKEQIKEYCADSCPEDQLNRSLLHHAVWRGKTLIFVEKDLLILIFFFLKMTIQFYNYSCRIAKVRAWKFMTLMA